MNYWHLLERVTFGNPIKSHRFYKSPKNHRGRLYKFLEYQFRGTAETPKEMPGKNPQEISG